KGGGRDDKWTEDLERGLYSVMCKDGDKNYRKTADEVFDNRTLMLLHKLISNGFLNTVDFPISTGKEGNVFKATSGDGKGLALKIYRTSNANFKAISNYIHGDPRFSGLSVSNNKHKLLTLWCLKEFKNLTRMQRARVRVPAPVRALQNVLIMEYVGDEGCPAPMIKSVDPSDLDMASVFEDIVENMALTYQKAHLVHADLSEYNILYWEEKAWIIDVAQGVVLEHPMAETWLRRDASNICNFFGKRGVKKDVESIIARIKGEE
ncbi:MAG: serine protein kinase RIO, partial [Candidatus Thermoplasmatota archaeon]|nr:serine protein kinase RIO [Candidatus Thermoplasmatota archaeon]